MRHGSNGLSSMDNPHPRSSSINSRLSSMRHGKHHHHSSTNSTNSTNNKLHHSPSLRRLSIFSMTHLT